MLFKEFFHTNAFNSMISSAVLKMAEIGFPVAPPPKNSLKHNNDKCSKGFLHKNSHFLCNLKNGFTLAETLMTLVIIGVIAAMTLPNLNTNVNQTVSEKSKKIFEGKLNEALHVMQLHGDLAKQYESTEAFVSSMKNYIKISKVCDNEHLTDCFASKVMRSTTTVMWNDVSQLKTSNKINSSFTTQSNIVGLVFADGVTGLIAYDKNCMVADKFSQDANVSACFMLYYDINGVERPNLYNDDIIAYTDMSIKNIDVGWIFDLASLQNAPYNQAACTAAYQAGAPITYCNMTNDYWAAAVDACFRQGQRLPTRAELQDLAIKLYGESIPLSGEVKNLTVKDRDLWVELTNGNINSSVMFWSSEQSAAQGARYAYYREFTSSSTSESDWYRNDSSRKAFCVAN